MYLFDKRCVCNKNGSSVALKTLTLIFPLTLLMFQTSMDRQEEARAASEEERIRRLMLEGIIEAPDDYRAVIHGEHHKPRTPKKKKRRKGKRAVSRLRKTLCLLLSC